jgi:tetratricopeptide (TPR) repeat protein
MPDSRPRLLHVNPQRFLVAALLIMALGLGYCLRRFGSSPTAESQHGQAALHRAETLIHAAAASAQSGDYTSALSYFAQVEIDDDVDDVDLRVTAGEAAYDLGLVSVAERHLRAALAQDPRHLQANGLLAYILMLEGRTWEAVPYLREPIRIGKFPLEHLIFLVQDRPIANPEQIERIQFAEPDNPVPMIGVARTALTYNDVPRALTLLRRVIDVSPEQIEAQVWLGEILRHRSGREFLPWHSQLPASADDHPGIWRVRGSWFAQQNRHRAAIACYREAVRLNPNDREAVYSLGQQLSIVGEAELAAECLTRAAALQRLETIVDDVHRQQDRRKGPEMLSLMQKAAETTESLGRPWEARAWASLALEIDGNLEWARQLKRRLSSTLAPESAWTTALSRDLWVELSRYELPDLGREPDLAAEHGTGDAPGTTVTFEDVASSLGVHFVYFNGADPDDDEVGITETTGGGVAVIDYDRDQWPDLYFTQGGYWPERPDQELWPDAFYRNSGDGQMWSVAASAGLGDTNFSQGVTVGDFDNDGFEDIYVANIGANRLYGNNGDGTFTDVTAQLAIEGAWWTTSCLLADLNGDSLPDIYDVNYVANEDISSGVCRRGDDIGICGVKSLASAQDRLFLNLGDGGFQDVTQAAGIIADRGTGLGIVAADFTGSGVLSLFIANDGFPNFFFVRTSPAGDPPRYTESATLRGLAYNRSGLPQACMGVAAGDADANGFVDLFVTNFFRESNTLYLNRGNLVFDDCAESSRLRMPSLSKLGFGTQFVDGDLDGHLDLVVANGHVYDMSDGSTPYEMLPQYFHNRGNGEFEEVDGIVLGRFFQEKNLGRGMARLDWNRDGKEDFAISHMNAPAAIVTNSSRASGLFLTLELCGTHCSRDAIGASVTARFGGQSSVRQLTAGDGYQSSNQRQIVIGLGEADRVDELVIRWPSGTRQVLQNLNANQQILVVEGRSGYFEINATPIAQNLIAPD